MRKRKKRYIYPIPPGMKRPPAVLIPEGRIPSAKVLLHALAAVPTDISIPFLLHEKDGKLAIVSTVGASPYVDTPEITGWILAFLARSMGMVSKRSCRQCQNLVTEDKDGRRQEHCYSYARDKRSLSPEDFSHRWGWRTELMKHAGCCPEANLCPWWAEKK